MNNLDRRIANIFVQRGYQTNKSLAKELGVAERTIRRHVNHMILNGLISLVVIPDPVVCGMNAWTKIGVKTEPTHMHNIADTLVRHPSVYFVAYSLGRFDIVIAAHFNSIGRLESFVNTELAGLRGVTGSETWMLASPRKYYRFSWQAPGEASEKEKPFVLGNLDQNIVAMLWQDGRASVADISSRLGRSQATVRRRMLHMFDSGICIREVVMSTAMHGTDTWATIGISTKGRDVHEIITELLRFPAVYLASSSLGKFNIILSTRFRSIETLNRFVMDDLPTIVGITSTETFVHNVPLKYHNVAVRPRTDSQ